MDGSDPLSATLSSSPEASPVPSSSALSWKKHDLFAEPFSDKKVFSYDEALDDIANPFRSGTDLDETDDYSATPRATAFADTRHASANSAFATVPSTSGEAFEEIVEGRTPFSSADSGQSFVHGSVSALSGGSFHSLSHSSANPFAVSEARYSTTAGAGISIDGNPDIRNSMSAAGSGQLGVGSSAANSSMTAELSHAFDAYTTPSVASISASDDLSECRVVSQSGPASLPLPASFNSLAIYHAKHDDLAALKSLSAPSLLSTISDADGETLLHKAVDGRASLSLLSYLVRDAQLDANSRDNDGWTPVHIAASKGYLHIVRFLSEVNADIDCASRHGFTPLMNAAAKGHLPIVQYLTTKHRPDAFARNRWGETAFDLAAAVFELSICDVLERYERASYGPSYNSLAVHSTVPVAIFENQRLGLRVATGTSKWSSRALTRNDGRSAFTLENEGVVLPLLKEEIQLPSAEDGNALRLPPMRDIRAGGKFSKRSVSHQDSAQGEERGSDVNRISTGPDATQIDASGLFHANSPESNAKDFEAPSPWYWASDWAVDVTDKHASHVDGWSYSPTFDALHADWQPAPPPELAALMTRLTLTAHAHPHKFVRHRRWVRIMRRRPDLPGSLPEVPDYIVRAQFFVGDSSVESDTEDERALYKRALRIQIAIRELRSGADGDTDEEHRAEAETLIENYERELAALPLDAETDGTDMNASVITNESTDSLTSAQSTSAQSASGVSADSSVSFSAPNSRAALLSHISDSISLSAAPALPTEAAHAIAQSAEFVLPRADLPSLPPLAAPLPAIPVSEAPSSSGIIAFHDDAGSPRWEPDEASGSCRRCGKRFNFFIRKHHCRLCGRLVCAACSSNVDLIDSRRVLRDPSDAEYNFDAWMPEMTYYRTCDDCHHVMVKNDRGYDEYIAESSSTARTNNVDDGLSDCPVCGRVLATIGDSTAQEEHLNDCLQAGGGHFVNSHRYVVFTLQSDSTVVEEECRICFEEFEVGDRLARLPCLCYFHKACISAWLDRGKECPFHPSK